ncbi:hypothetical protein GHV40_16100 [Devosia sp. D6-9]|nr:hypothetical protein GHV40_16100 [Devosia sp. D6-9]
MTQAHEAITLGIGRQLLFDDFLIESTTLERRFHRPQIHPATPVLAPETAIEMNGGYCPVACTFQDGVFFDSEDQLFKMTYQAGWFQATALATSRDGIHWDRSILDVDGATNRILPISYPLLRDGGGFWLDTFAKDRSERFKMLVFYRRASHPSMGYTDHQMHGVKEEFAEVYTSPDAIHWAPRGRTSHCGDNSNFYYNPFDQRWYYSLRTNGERGRQRSFHAHTDFVEGRNWDPDRLQLLAIADDIDRADPTAETPPEIYNFDAVGYESVMLGVYGILRGPQNPASFDRGLPKITDLEIGFSRDGLTWTRPDRSAPFLSCSKVPGAWDRGYLHASGGVCCVVGDKLYFYVSAFSGTSPMLGTHMYAGGSVGLAVLRRDGFASMSTGAQGELLTKPLLFSGGYLFVNADAAGGNLSVEIRDAENRPIPGFAASDCRPVTTDGVSTRVEWANGDVAALSGRPVRFHFQLDTADLYAFWVSRLPTGQSDGYLAAGGPGYSGVVDN